MTPLGMNGSGVGWSGGEGGAPLSPIQRRVKLESSKDKIAKCETGAQVPEVGFTEPISKTF